MEKILLDGALNGASYPQSITLEFQVPQTLKQLSIRGNLKIENMV